MEIAHVPDGDKDASKKNAQTNIENRAWTHCRMPEPQDAAQHAAQHAASIHQRL
jgi:hypothetical protein